MSTRRCRWCHRPVSDRRRYYCDKHCSENWAHYCSAARDSDEQRAEWITGRLMSMADSAAVEGNAELLIKLSRELRQLRPPPSSQTAEIDTAAKELLDVFG